MLIDNPDACWDERITSLKPKEFAAFIWGFAFSSKHRRERLTTTFQRRQGITPAIARRLVEVGLARMDADDALIWTCDGIAKYSGRHTDPSEDYDAGVTYLIQAGDNGDVKIGSTRQDPHERLKALQIGSSEPLRLIKVLPGRHLERQLHDRYAPLRTRGEWFDARILDNIS